MLEEEKLIKAVRKHQELYDTNNPNYMKSKVKTIIWTEIAKELHLKNGEAAKDKWLKLRGSFRDARRRHQKSINSGASPHHIKPWKFESQMSFLEAFMSSGQREGNIVESDDESQLSLQPSDKDPLQSHNVGFAFWESEGSSKLDPGRKGVPANENGTKQSMSTHEGRDDDDHEMTGRTEFSTTPTQNSSQLIPTKKARKNKNDISSLMARSIQHREVRAQQRAEEKRKILKGMKNTGDHLYNFFMSMYQVTKNMPQHYQHRIRAQVFQAVSDAEAEVMNITINRTPSSISFLSSTSIDYSPASHQSPYNSTNSQHMQPIHHTNNMKEEPENVPNDSSQPTPLVNFICKYPCDD